MEETFEWTAIVHRDFERKEGYMQFKAVHRLGLLLCVGLISFSMALAQSTGTYRGVIEDDTGAVVPGVKVSLTRNAAEVANTVSNESGQFAFNGLAQGEYELKAEAQGFNPAGVHITVGPTAAPLQHIALKVANLNQEITVSAGDPVTMDGNINSIEVDHDLLKSLPVADDNPLAAAALFVDPAANSAEGTKIVVDGVEGTDLDVPSSSVKSVAVNKNPYSAEFSRPGKGRIEVITRPGSLHRVHHHLVMNYRNSSLDATNAFARTQPQMAKSLLEGDINGPLFAQKGSFYLGGEYLRDDRSSVIHALLPGNVVSENVLNPERTGRFLSRVDYKLNPEHTLSMRYNFSHDSVSNQGIGAFDLATRGYNTAAQRHEFRLTETALLSLNFSNEVRFAFKDKDYNANPVSSDPAVMVLGAFNSGGAQLRQQQNEKSYELQNLSTWVHGKHTIRFGAAAKRRDLDVNELSNFGGTFMFSDLASFAANQPFLFTINQGIPEIAFAHKEYSYFVQDEMRLRQDLTVLAGIRHEFQSGLSDHNNVAPRVGISYAPGRKDWVIRAGAGIFYDREPWTMAEQALLFNDIRIRRIVIQNPGFTTVPVTGLGTVPDSIVTISPLLHAPYVMQASAGVDKQFGRNNSLSVEYTTMRGLKLFRMINVNAPSPVTGLPPNGNFTNINQFDSTGSSRMNSLSITHRTALAGKIELLSQYTLSKSTDDTSSMFTLPSDNFNLALERGRSDFDRRHRLSVAGIFQLPYNFKFGTITSISSGLPFNITTGTTLDAGNAANTRPLGVARNTGAGPMYSDVDIRLSKKFILVHREKSAPYMELRADAFNVLNQVNATNYIGVITSPLFGRANSAFPARQLQFSMKASF
jgi:carboxypeptidase family protein/TonB-dependent receptor-like protein